jgi:hypothetical protein
MTEDFHNVLAASNQERLDLFVGTAARLRTDAENTISTWRQPLLAASHSLLMTGCLPLCETAMRLWLI